MRQVSSSRLCRDEQARERLLDMDRRLKGARPVALAVLAVALLIAAPWEGWWTLIPLALACAAFTVTAPLMSRAKRPEYVVAAAWMLSAVTIAIAVALTGGPLSPAVAWLAIPAPGLAARFDRRGLIVGVAFLAVLMVGVTVGVHPAAVLARPALLLSPLALLIALALLTTPLTSSELQHRSESVLDVLTGMLNRRSLPARAAELEEQAVLTGQWVGVIVCDLDHFKAVNDAGGHQVGDAVLVDVAYTLRKELRAFDLAYRLGGEEFLVLLPGSRLEETIALAERLRIAVDRSHPAGMHVTMSFGVASACAGAVRYAELLAAADSALYAAKRAGRNRVEASGHLHVTKAAAA
jgi:diguanylate cyclase (GGDEF)-like protein